MKTRKKIFKINKSLKSTKPQLDIINNYRVVFIKNNSKILSMQSYIFNGFIHETNENLGINHLLEHVLSEAYKKCKNFNCFEYLTRLGIQSNASTSNNILNYYTFGLSKDIDIMLDYIVKTTVKPEFNITLINREKQAVHNELLQNIDGSRYKIFNRTNKLLYKLYGLKNIYNAEQQLENLKKFNYNNLHKYYEKNYTNNNTLFIISGNFKKSHIIEKLQKILPMKKHLCEIPKKLNNKYFDCFTDKKEMVFLKNSKLVGTQIVLCFPTTIKFNSEKLINLKFTKDVLTYYLFDLLRIQKKLIYGLEFSIDVTACGSVIDIFINTKTENLLQVLKLLKYTINYYKKNLIKNKDLEPFKKRFMVKYHNTYYSSKDLADIYGNQYIYQHFIGSKILHPEIIKKLYLKVTNRDIQNSIQENFNFNKSICVYSNNDKAVDFEF